MVDLDAFQADLELAGGVVESNAAWGKRADAFERVLEKSPALMAELRAAWEVIDKARQHNDCSVCAKAIAAYEKFAGEAPQ